MDTLLAELKNKLVTILNLTNVQPDDINDNEQLVGGELGLDSIDVLEMVVMIEKDYGVTINNKEIGTQVFASLTTLADYIRANSPKCPP